MIPTSQVFLREKHRGSSRSWPEGALHPGRHGTEQHPRWAALCAPAFLTAWGHLGENGSPQEVLPGPLKV